MILRILILTLSALSRPAALPATSTSPDDAGAAAFIAPDALPGSAPIELDPGSAGPAPARRPTARQRHDPLAPARQDASDRARRARRRARVPVHRDTDRPLESSGRLSAPSTAPPARQL